LLLLEYEEVHVNVAILLYDGFSVLDAIGPYEVLARVPGAKIRFTTKAGPRAVRADTGFVSLVADHDLTLLSHLDVLVIPGGPGAFGVLKDQEMTAWVRHAYEAARWTLTVCSGSLILGATGVLAGRDATTSWFIRDQLAQFGATYKAEHYVCSGKIITAAGSTTGIDAALLLAAEIAGEDVARAMQLGLEYDPKPPFDSGSFAKASPELLAVFKTLEAQSRGHNGV
jgi:putative intracellular protease/amidase